VDCSFRQFPNFSPTWKRAIRRRINGRVRRHEQTISAVVDFSAGTLADIRSEDVEVVDAKIWNLPGGKHVRFLTGGVSWLEATFAIPAGVEAPTHLTMRHLSSSPDGNRPGFSPVRITLNGNEIFRGTPAQKAG
jgi:hypothetical protein